MESLTIAALAAFAQITSHVSDFVAHRKADKAATEQEFFGYLTIAHQDELVQLIKSTAGISAGVKALLTETREELSTKIDALTRSFAELASATRGFAPLMGALVPNVSLSEQAISILGSLSKSGASNFIEWRRGTNSGIDLILNGPGSIEVTEQKFLDSDLTDLVRLGLLRMDYTSKGNRRFHITRHADALVRSLG